MENFAGKKRPIINLSLFTSFPGSFSSEKSMKSPRDFEGGVVGLGIVAAMTDLNQAREALFSAKFSGAAANLSLSPRSNPIPIVSPARPAANFKGGGEMVEAESTAVVDEDELSESYTCVISHIGNSSVKKRVYLDDKLNGVVFDDRSSAATAACVDSNALFSASPLNFGGDVMREFGAPDFLSSCYLCNKQLHGLDIFMYRGEKAFCSTDCRGKHMRSDKRKEKCRSEATKPLEYSVSPCSGPMVFFAGVAAA